MQNSKTNQTNQETKTGAARLEEFAVAHNTEIIVASNLIGMVIGGVYGMRLRKRLYDAGMVKSIWYGLIKPVGTYRTPQGYFKEQ